MLENGIYPARSVLLALQEHFNRYWEECSFGQIHTAHNNGKKLRTYKLLKQNIWQEKYLDVLTKKSVRASTARFRISAHNLHIERGRYNNTELALRTCNVCNSDVVEDEFHFLLMCPMYTEARNSLFHKANLACRQFTNLNDEMKFIWLLTSEAPEIIRATATFIHDSFQTRNTKLGILNSG